MAAEPYDVVIIGGAIMGASIGWFLTQNPDFDGTIAIVERDSTFQYASTTLSAASIRQQFSTPENIALSRFGLSFLKGMPDHFGPDADIGLVAGGYLILASEDGENTLRSNYAVQQQNGADILWLSANELGQKFPWLNLDDLCAGTLGQTGEGWFDAHLLLSTLRKALKSQPSVTLIDGEVDGFKQANNRVTDVTLTDGQTLSAGHIVNAAGPQAGRLCQTLGIDLPVEPRKRCVFYQECPDTVPGLPLLCDPSGFYVRPEGKGFICGMPPAHDPAADHDFTVDYPLFETELWPRLAHRIPTFERLRQTGAWAGHYDYNAFDQNAVLGSHPELQNFMFANGFSGHGLQHGPGVGRALAELIVYGHYQSIDLSLFAFDRLLENRPVIEQNVI
ncbi:NAD(P)/FAD-dependent oxidoreductase [Coralliovum pocilloporae]|uniref:NAD(P)/FAD-dependent oxidoreductase n=1 Tax=Coralliovum pocilloporae TaxID=3066369 RepID=UPI0033072DD4